MELFQKTSLLHLFWLEGLLREPHEGIPLPSQKYLSPAQPDVWKNWILQLNLNPLHDCVKH